MAFVPIRPLGLGELGQPAASLVAGQRANSPAAAGPLADLAGGMAQTAGLKSIGEVQRFVAAIRHHAKEAGAPDSETQDDGGGGTLPYENLAAQLASKINRTADKVFELVMQFAGDDPKLLSQARGLVTQVFARVKDRHLSPMQAFLVQERVMQLICVRLAQMTSAPDVNLSA